MVSAHEKEALEYLSGFVPGMLSSSFTRGDGTEWAYSYEIDATETASQAVGLSSTVLPCCSCNIVFIKCEEDS